MNIKSKSGLIISILIPLAVGATSALFSGGMDSAMFNKPQIYPPAYVFPIVWTILYVLMGASSYMVYYSDSVQKRKAIAVYGVQLFFNFFWSIIFFRFMQYSFAFIWLIALTAVVIYMTYLFYKARHTAGYLQIPYIVWCIFAIYLNFMISILN